MNKTKAKLDQIILAINQKLGTPTHPYTIIEGTFTSAVGNFHSDYSPELGYSVYRFGEGLSISEPIWTGRLLIGPAISAATAFLNGLNFQS